MNKKIIAIAIATAMAAPVAMADLKVSGRLSQDFTSISKEAGTGTDDAAASHREIADNGQNRVEFTFGEGNVFGKYAVATTKETAVLGQRDQFIGYKFGDVKVSMGRIANASKNAEKDPLIASFLQVRKSYAEAATDTQFGSSGFISNLVSVTGKSGGMAWTVQMDPTDNSSGANEGHIGLGLKGKAGGVNYWVGYNTGTGDNGGASNDETNTKVGASMKFGKIKATLNVSIADDAASDAWTAMAVSADMGLGGGAAVHATFATTTGRAAMEGTFTRLAYSNKVNKSATAYAGLTLSTPDGGDTTTVMGGGMVVKF